MPYGPSPIFGLAAYSTIKLIGYSLAGNFLNHRYKATAPRPIVFGIARTVLGIIVGVCSVYFLSKNPDVKEAEFFVGLIPIRFFEWALVIFIFFERQNFQLARISKYSLIGIGWPFLLDIPVIASFFVIPGGFWVC